MEITRGMSVLGAVGVFVVLLGGGAWGQLTNAEQKCIDGYNNKTRLVSQQAGKSARACIKNAGKGTEPDPDNCIVSNTDGKILGKEAKVGELYSSGKCLGSEPIQQGAATGNAAHRDAITDLAHMIFGDPVMGVITPGTVAAKCQDKAIKRSTQVFTAKVKAFRRCKKDLMQTGAITDSTSLDALCMTPTIPDPVGKIAKTVAKLDGDVNASCASLALPVLFPGMSAGCTTDAAALASCLEVQVECKVCLALNEADGMSHDCDLFDDGLANSSCVGVGGTCPLTAGIYTSTVIAGGTFTLDSLSPFSFPIGGTIVQHVYAASPPGCVHNTVVPDPGGFTAPAFCIPGFNFSVRTTQDGCGVGRIDSNGGSDFTITETGDTSSPTVCGLPASNCATPPGDSNVQVNVQVGGNGADVCGSGTANAVVAVPVHTIIWSHVPFSPCPDPDGMPLGSGDTTIVEFDQTLDFTTDTASADWTDLDPDGCCVAGSGPGSPQACAFGGGGPGGLTATGTCVDLTGINVAGADVTTVASGTVGSNGSPLYDYTYSTSLPNAITGPSGAATAVCGSPPLINFAGTAMRCVP